MHSLLLSTLLLLLASTPALAGPCEKMKLDLDKGTLNGISVKATLATVRKAFPCPAKESKYENTVSLYFEAAGFFFTPGQSITVSSMLEPGFNGSLSKDLLGASADQVEEALGASQYQAREVADESLGYYFYYAFYTRPWGTLILKYDYYTPSHVEEITLSTESLASLKKKYP
ncbi:hypothetical protein COW36_15525 [bacterium (Candidatus Blackallbacteria) CG17_big_fil_post_rev_8_21_14_2_50_48_46]|uniref:Uncharacterized protein n=1 Tax=bacterium (Candidatus Blackallbacteria) CG17_big_fil_post_rev_8_21_14_2_50_48_46 TaxID=2014261 RepID=A0A2M7G268_9BACT|nr:MAG: hypothetical protein COW64_07710 [bacterium (Candidatus Blackallbacteria) CG18_big_fil_WC_8_21_14_2_50_49_26]PIW15878.1 MAG: hypothetical protein COW36_15525 [bacterium (Candidatus Blackallbacteria) CG17_big_fil_post_rev_8_21_14_2_50_48_46]PIW48657.1 MAG: hypothetical protein COW20_08645 [bacterium (Candidatus Blackallbacteria) CG13_big_fil_rev_8_21_14_2_50_49_14]